MRDISPSASQGPDRKARFEAELANLTKHRARDFMGIAEDILETALTGALSFEINSSLSVFCHPLKQEAGKTVYMVVVPSEMRAHLHLKGDEDYAVYKGQGRLRFGPTFEDPSASNGSHKVQEVFFLALNPGDHYTVRAGYAHEVVSDGKLPLVLLVRCSPEQLAAYGDRVMLGPLTGETREY
ncbi:MAG: hypothetical protein KDD70_11480 [Bdellovibrionales bacterium]|nr:hypothetical protein [Bdellovibrionales bacterium]